MERLAAYLRENWDAKACDISTHRAGLSGRLVVGLKRLMHRLTRPYLNVALARQTAFNNQLVVLQSILVSQLTAPCACAWSSPRIASTTSRPG